jgi:hypothetical protein
MAKAHELVDNFNDNAIDTTKWTEFGAPAPISERIREINGQIEVRPRSTDTGLYSGFMSATQYDLTDSYAHLELVRAPKAIAGLGCSFLAKTAANDFVYFFLEAAGWRPPC